MKDQYPEEYEQLLTMVQALPPSAILALLGQAAGDIGLEDTEKCFQDYSEQINDAEWENSEPDEFDGD